MRSPYGIMKLLYRRCFPKSIRAIIWNRKYPFYRMFGPIKGALQSYATHDEIYDNEYYLRDVDPAMLKSADVMARSMTERYRPETVIDLGCGTGALLAAFQGAGVRGRGYEYADAGIAIARSRGIDVRKFDLESKEEIQDEADLVVSTEVAEHLPEAWADEFVRRVTQCGRIIVITAATPDQGGEDHVNEQPNSYWIAKFKERGAIFDEPETSALRNRWKAEGVQYFYAGNVMVFRRE